jgi:AcrR family transcriptional regulator
MTRTRTRRLPRLSTDEIVQAALRLLKSGGHNQLSMRTLANEFDVWPNALYEYFKSKDDLLALLVDAVLEDVEPPSTELPWTERILVFSLDMRHQLAPYPDLAAFMLKRTGLTPRVQTLNYETITIFLDAGFDQTAAARAFIAVYTYVLGSLSLVRVPAHKTRERVGTMGHSSHAGKDAGDELVAALDAIDVDEQFAYGLERLLDGLAQDRARQVLSRKTPAKRAAAKPKTGVRASKRAAGSR